MKLKEQIIEISRKPSKELEEKLQELTMMLIKSYGFKKEVKKELRNNIRKHIARIKAELIKRKNGKD